MNVFIKLTTVVFFFSFFISCQESTGVELRIENTSDIRYDRISVNNVSFGPLDANEVSDYLPFENIYRHEFIEVLIDDQVLKVIPEEFNNQDFFDSGKFRYEVDILHRKWLSVKFTEE